MKRGKSVKEKMDYFRLKELSTIGLEGSYRIERIAMGLKIEGCFDKI
jgi:hypothetical protein